MLGPIASIMRQIIPASRKSGMSATFSMLCRLRRCVSSFSNSSIVGFAVAPPSVVWVVPCRNVSTFTLLIFILLVLRNAQQGAPVYSLPLKTELCRSGNTPHRRRQSACDLPDDTSTVPRRVGRHSPNKSPEAFARYSTLRSRRRALTNSGSSVPLFSRLCRKGRSLPTHLRCLT